MTYFRLRQRLLAHGIDLPAEKKYRDGAAAPRPRFEHYRLQPGEEPVGVKANFKACLELTFKEIMEGVEKKMPQFQGEVQEGGEPRKLYATVKYGLGTIHIWCVHYFEIILLSPFVQIILRSANQ